MSNHIFSLKPNDSLDFKGPIAKYPWESNKHQSIALVAGGTGITPMYQLIRAILKNPDDKTKITLLFANVSTQDILLRKELDDLATKYPRQFKTVYVVDKVADEEKKNWQGETGYITKELLKTHLPEPKEENVKVFVCGPPPLYKAISGGKKSPSDQGELTGYLKELGYEKDQVFKF
jgi:cytochrome-b5 reductase